MTNDSHQRFAFVVDWLENSYQQHVLRGAAEAALMHGVPLVVFAGGDLSATESNPRNVIYRAISPVHYRGAVVMTGTLGNVRDVDVRQEILPEFPPAGLCHIAARVEGSSNIIVDNRSGVRELVDHLVRTHRARSIAFIRGPETNIEAEERYAAYREGVERNGLVFHERLVAPGDFRGEAGAAAVRLFLDHRKVHFDALIAADDMMALSAMAELQRRGLRVPEDIAVVGFDDVDEARYGRPPLSTVRQPLSEQGQAALEQLMRGGGVARDITLATQCVFRRSCGCAAEEPGFLTERPKIHSRTSLDISLEQRRKQILEELGGAVHFETDTVDSAWPESLLSAFLRDIRGEDGAFCRAHDDLLEQLIASGQNASLGTLLISAFRRQVSICAGDDPGQIRQLENIMHDARMLNCQAVERSGAQRQIQAMNWMRTLSSFALLAAQITTRDELQRILEQMLPQLGITTCIIAAAVTPERARLVSGLLAGRALQRTVLGEEFSNSDLLPPSLSSTTAPPSEALAASTLQNGVIVVQPLTRADSYIGYMLLAWGEAPDFVGERLREILSVALARL